VVAGLGKGARETIRVVSVDGEEMIESSGYLLGKQE
jgi:hypothetical protein